jgi:hypothetical protein
MSISWIINLFKIQNGYHFLIIINYFVTFFNIYETKSEDLHGIMTV